MKSRDFTMTNKLVDNIEAQGVTRVLNSHFSELISLGSSSERNVCKVFRDYLMSRFGLEYFSKLNLLVKKRFASSTSDERDMICRWIDNDVMERFNEVCETEIFDNPRALSALSEMILALYSSINIIDEEDIEEEVEYIFDIPYRLNEMVQESPRVSRFYSHSFKREELGWSERATLQASDKSFSVSYTMDLGK